MFRTKSFAALSLVAAVALTGCGAPGLTVTAPVSKLGKSAPAVAAPAPTVSVVRGQEDVSRQHVPATNLKASTLSMVESVEMSQEEVAELADSIGYSVQADSSMGTIFGMSGMVRSTETGFALVTTKGIFKKTETIYTLDAEADLLDQLSARQNKKAFVKGVQYANNHVKVTSVKSELNLGALFNVFTKGKVSGHVDGADGKALADAKVFLKSAKGFTFSATSDAEGDYVVKGLEAGDYTATVSKDGFKAATMTITVEKRHAVKLQGDLAAAE